MNRRLTILCIWLIALVAGCAAGTNTPVTRPTETKAATTSFVDQTNGFSIEYPASWMKGMATTTERDNSCLELAPGGDALVQIGGGLGDTFSGGDRMKNAVEYFRGVIKGPDGAVDSTEMLKLDGSPAWKIRETLPIPGQTGVTKKVAWLAFHGDRLFVLYYEAPETTYARNLPAVERIAESLRWAENPASSGPNRPA